MFEAVPSDPITQRARIVAAARRQLFTFGYQALTMDALATELGMSKKTLYVHFASKETIVDTVVEGFAEDVKAMAATLFDDDSQSYAVKLVRFTEAMTERFARVPPTLFRELQRYAPAVYRRIEELRFNTIPVVFGRLVAAGQRTGEVRAAVDPVFATEFWRHAMQGLMHPDTTERLGLRPDQVFTRALNLFCGGLLTPAGLHDYEKLTKA